MKLCVNYLDDCELLDNNRIWLFRWIEWKG